MRTVILSVPPVRPSKCNLSRPTWVSKLLFFTELLVSLTNRAPQSTRVVGDSYRAGKLGHSVGKNAVSKQGSLVIVSGQELSSPHASPRSECDVSRDREEIYYEGEFETRS
jgi:hypothetical protein